MKDVVILNEDYIEKIFAKDRLSIPTKVEKAHIILSSLNLKYIQVPKKMYYDNFGTYIKYRAPYFKNSSKKYNDFFLMKIEYLIENLLQIEKEIDIISNKHIKMRDVYEKNTTFYNEIYIIDPGSYTYEKDDSINKVRLFNYEKLRSLIINIIYITLKNEDINPEFISKLILDLNDKTRYFKSISTYFKSLNKNDMLIKDYIYEKIKMLSFTN